MKKCNIKVCFLAMCLLLSMGIPVYAAQEKENKTEESVVQERLIIANKREFLEFAENCRLDKFSENLIVSLEADIDLSGNEFEGIPIFCGMLEGNHHTISGLSIHGDGSVKGLIRYLTEGAVVQNLSVNGKVSPQGSRSYIGGIAGSNGGSIVNCSFDGEIKGKDYVGSIAGINEVSGTIENCEVKGDIQGVHFVGGMAGENLGVIRDCSNFANINTQVQENNLEVSDITMEALTNSEASYTVTDVGGIAGGSSGVIRGCDNQGTIGYKHIGYNIGGIAGSQTGYVFECDNQGQIFGRKEVGGIVGQMEPVVNLEFSADTLQILEGQLNSATGKIKQSTERLQTKLDADATDLNRQISKLQNDLNHSGDAVTQLLKDVETKQKQSREKEKKNEEESEEEDSKNKNSWDVWDERISRWENLSLPDEDNLLAARNSLNKSMSSMNDTLNSITANSQSNVDMLTEEMQGIVNQAKNITYTVSHASDNLGVSFTDVSDEDTPDNLLGKIEKCTNTGWIQADLNGGGILGVVAVENDLDPEEEVEINGDTSLNLEGELRAVILNCENSEKVTVKNQNCGGIVGWLSLGLVKDCMNTGSLDAENADYVGGITGRSTGYIRNNYAKCKIYGKTYVGGIAGSASTVTECRSMVQLNSGSERIGNIVGQLAENYREEENPIKDNYYLDLKEDLGGIDGISYFGLAEPMERDAFLNLENLPEEFWKVKVIFVQEDNSQSQVVINQGAALALEDIPAVTPKDGYIGSWKNLKETDISEILFDISFEALYTPVKGTIPSKTTGEKGKSKLLLQGKFSITEEVALIEIEGQPEMTEEQTLIDTLGFVLEEGEMATGARYLIPNEVKGEHLSAYVRSPETQWHEVESTVDGSYLVFELKNGENQIAVLETKSMPSVWLGVAVVVLMILVIAIILERRQKGLEESASKSERNK